MFNFVFLCFFFLRSVFPPWSRSWWLPVSVLLLRVFIKSGIQSISGNEFVFISRIELFFISGIRLFFVSRIRVFFVSRFRVFAVKLGWIYRFDDAVSGGRCPRCNDVSSSVTSIITSDVSLPTTFHHQRRLIINYVSYFTYDHLRHLIIKNTSWPTMIHRQWHFIFYNGDKSESHLSPTEQQHQQNYHHQQLNHLSSNNNVPLSTMFHQQRRRRTSNANQNLIQVQRNNTINKITNISNNKTIKSSYNNVSLSTTNKDVYEDAAHVRTKSIWTTVTNNNNKTININNNDNKTINNNNKTININNNKTININSNKTININNKKTININSNIARNYFAWLCFNLESWNNIQL